MKDRREARLLDRIVVPLDGSELSERIGIHVRRLLKRSDGEVVLVRVLPPETIRGDKGTGAALDAARADLDRIVAALESEGAKARGEVLVGDPADRIVTFAREERASLVAMSTHGRTGLARWIRGSTAERVLRTSPIPVLLSNPFGLADQEELRFRRILVPLDGSDMAAEILPLVAELGRLYESEIILQMVVPLPVTGEPLMYPLLMSTEEVEKTLECYRDRLPGLRVVSAAEFGAPAISIVERAEHEKADLIALTTHGRTGTARWASGSVAEQVLRHAPSPLLVKRTVPSPEFKESS